MKIREMARTERPREKMLLLGRELLSNRELLAIIIKTGTKSKSSLNIADELLNMGQGGLVDLMDLSMEELMKVDGIGVAKAAEISAAIELSRRISTTNKNDNGTIESVQDVISLFMEQMRYYKKEVFKALLLDAKGKIITVDDISVGDLSSSVVHPRETFIGAIRRSAAAIILIHNHPSGDPKPSDEDVRVTNRLMDAGELLGIKVLDHIVIGDGTYCSMKAKKII